jgi:Region found in RelA / SpoT proteins.
MRKGDSKKEYNKLERSKVEFDDESGIYRSIHYTIKTELKAKLEIQTRTIFEEGWSEIHHQLLYKKTAKEQDPKTLQYISGILNRLVGDCNELGELMKNIACFEPNPSLSEKRPDTSLISLINQFLIEQDRNG